MAVGRFFLGDDRGSSHALEEVLLVEIVESDAVVAREGFLLALLSGDSLVFELRRGRDGRLCRRLVFYFIDIVCETTMQLC